MSTTDTTEAARSHLRKTLTWRDGVALAMASAVGLFTSFGYFLGVISAWTAIAVWVVGLLVALLQNKIFAEMAAMFPDASGGVSRYAIEGWKRHSAPLSAVAAFGYWLGWCLAASVTALILGQVVVATWIPEATQTVSFLGNELGLAHVIAAAAMLGGWAFNYFGAQLGASAMRAMGILVVAGLVLISAASFFSPAAEWNISQLTWGVVGDWRTLVVIAYATAWTAYGTEVGASFAPEYKNTVRDTSRALRYGALLMLALFTVVPLAVTGSIGEAAFAENPTTYLVVALDKALGGFGWVGTIVIILSLLGTLLSATADSSRALYGLAQEGMTLKQFGTLNSWGVPGSATTIGVVLNLAIMVAVGSPISILLACNLGYVVAIILGLSAFILLRKDRPSLHRPIKLGRPWIPIAFALIAFNLLLLIMGVTNPELIGYGGLRESLIAVGILLLSVVFFVYRRVIQDRLPMQWRVRDVEQDHEPIPATTGAGDGSDSDPAALPR